MNEGIHSRGAVVAILLDVVLALSALSGCASDPGGDLEGCWVNWSCSEGRCYCIDDEGKAAGPSEREYGNCTSPGAADEDSPYRCDDLCDHCWAD